MLDSFSTKAISAKSRAMYGNRLTNQSYTEMMKKTSISDAAAYLRDNTYYSKTLDHMDLSAAHRGQVEERIRDFRYEQYTSLTRYAPSTKSNFYDFLFLWDEIDQIIGVIRYITSATTNDYFFHYNKLLPQHCSYDLDALVRCTGFRDLLDVLSSTPYRKILEKHLSDAIEEKSKIHLVLCEKSLKIYYYNYIFGQIKKEFSANVAKELRLIFLHQIDMENITAAYRLKHFFKRDAKFIMESLLPYKTVSHKLIREIANSSDDKQLSLILNGSKLSKHQTIDSDYIESLTLRAREKICRRMMRYSTNAPVVLVSYMTLMEIEVENVINIIEAIRYGLPPVETKKLLILA